MQTKRIGIGVLVLIAALVGGWYVRQRAPGSTMKLTSSAFAEGQSIPVQYTCDGASETPPLTVSGIPDAAKSLVLTMVDPDAPVKGGFIHWVIFDISPRAADSLESGGFPLGATDGSNSSGKDGFVGPCPPSGIHHYVFTVHALDVFLELPSGTKLDAIAAAMQGHVIGTATLTGTYAKTR